MLYDKKMFLSKVLVVHACVVTQGAEIRRIMVGGQPGQII
jgi:hypothetical protein